jgi:hypothetical protein
VTIASLCPAVGPTVETVAEFLASQEQAGLTNPAMPFSARSG